MKSGETIDGVDANDEPSYALNFTHPGVEPDECVEVFSAPAEPFVGREMAVADARFEILMVFVGRKSQLKAGVRMLRAMDYGGLTAFRFTRPLDAAESVVGDAAYGVKLIVRNKSSTKMPFTGSVLGTLAYGRGESVAAHLRAARLRHDDA